MRQTISIEVGLMYFGALRDFLKLRQFHNFSVRWYESRGWFSKKFVIIADEPEIRYMSGALKQWSDSVNTRGIERYP